MYRHHNLYCKNTRLSSVHPLWIQKFDQIEGIAFQSSFLGEHEKTLATKVEYF